MKKILIVEDDKDISIELKALLENSGYEASILTDFKNASDEILRNGLIWCFLILISLI